MPPEQDGATNMKEIIFEVEGGKLIYFVPSGEDD